MEVELISFIIHIYCKITNKNIKSIKVLLQKYKMQFKIVYIIYLFIKLFMNRKSLSFFFYLRYTFKQIFNLDNKFKKLIDKL